MVDQKCGETPPQQILYLELKTVTLVWSFGESNMDRYLYRIILEEHLKSSVDNFGLGTQWIFLQDNDPKHIAHVVREWLIYYALMQLNSPLRPSDPNPIDMSEIF